MTKMKSKSKARKERTMATQTAERQDEGGQYGRENREGGGRRATRQNGEGRKVARSKDDDEGSTWRHRSETKTTERRTSI